MKKRLPNLFKTILATTSALTLVSSVATTAEAAAITSLNATSDINTPADWNPNGFNDGDSLIYGGNHIIQAVAIGWFNINVIDTAANPVVGRFIVDTPELRIGSISSTGGGGGVSVVLQGGSIVLGTMAGGGGILPNDYSKFASLDFNNSPGTTLVLQNSAPITLPTNFSSTGGSSGQIILDNSNTTTFNGTFSSTPGTMVESLVIGANSTAIFNKGVSVSKYLDIKTNATAIFAPNTTINADSIIAPPLQWSTNNTISFLGDAVVNVSTMYYSLEQMLIGSGEVDFRGDTLYVNIVNFTSADSVLKFNHPSSTGVIGALNNTTGIDGKGKIKVNTDIDVVNAVGAPSVLGAPGASFENLNFESNKQFSVRESFFHVQSVTTSANGQGIFVMRSDNDKEINTNMGAPTLKLNQVIPTIGYFNEGGVPNVFDTKATLKTGKSIHANEFQLYPTAYNIIYHVPMNSSLLVLEDNTFIDATITTLNPVFDPLIKGMSGLTTSEVDVLSNATILQDIGAANQKLTNIKFLGALGSKIDLSGDLHSQFIDLKQPNIVLGNDLVFDGQTSSDSTTYSLGNRTLSFDNAGTSKIVGDPVVNFTVDDSNHGHFVVKGGKLDMRAGGMNHLDLNLTDLAVKLPPPGPIGQSYIVFGIVDGSGQIAVVSNAKVDFNIIQQNPFVTWSYTNGIATRKRLDQSQINQIVAGAVSGQTATANALLLADANNTGDALAIFENITSTLMNNSSDLLNSINALQPFVVEAAEQISEAVDQAVSTIENRLRSLGIPAFALAQGEEGVGGVAAGDDGYKNGAWASTYYGTVHQKARGESAGFKSHTTGVMVGVDTMVTDDHTIGMALSYSSNKVKHKDGNEGDTSKVKTYTISIYGMQEINDKWFVQGVGLFSRNAINNREKRFVPGGIEIARGDFNVNAYGTELLVGYNRLLTDKVLMTTTMGAEYLRLSNSRYKETGTTNQNLLISKKDDDKLDAIIGTAFAYNGAFKSYTVIPEIHGNITYDVLNKSPNVSVQLTGLAGDRLVHKTSEQSRVFYNLGGGLSVLRGATEFSAGYDLYLGKKYIGHQGSLKARINF